MSDIVYFSIDAETGVLKQTIFKQGGAMKTKPKIIKKAFYFIGEVTVCLIRTGNGNVYRGVSVCCEDDFLDRAEGKKWAERYARRAMAGRECPTICKIEAIQTIAQLNVETWDIWKHGERKPKLTKDEIKLIMAKGDDKNFNYHPGSGVRFDKDVPF